MSDLPDWTTGVDILAQTIGNLNVDIVAETIAHLHIDIVAQSVGNLNVNIAASAVTLNVAIQSSAVTLNVNISSQSVNLNVNIAASAVTLNVAIASSAVTLNVAIQSSAVTLNVNVSTSVDINIKTSGGANIIIDKLVQDARDSYGKYLYPYNDGVEKTGVPADFTTGARGTFWRRGCAGVVLDILIYLKNTTAGPLSRTFYLYPFPGAAAIDSLTISQAANTTGWVTYNYYKHWFYDSLLIGCINDFPAGLSIGYFPEVGAYQGNGMVLEPGGWRPATYVPAIKVWVGGLGKFLPVGGTVTAVLLCDESKKQGGMWGVGDWSAYKGADKNFHTYALNKAPGTSISATYTVPADKTLYITSFTMSCWGNTAADRDLNQIVIGELWSGATVLVDIGGNGGAGITFSKPFAIAAGVVLTYLVANCSNHNANIDVTAIGYEV